MTYNYKHLKPQGSPAREAESPTFGRRRVMPDFPLRRRGASAASRIFCAAMIVCGLIWLALDVI
jgi:hypothetical protein